VHAVHIRSSYPQFMLAVVVEVVEFAGHDSPAGASAGGDVKSNIFPELRWVPASIGHRDVDGKRCHQPRKD
jgi:hypothetical protein